MLQPRLRQRQRPRKRRSRHQGSIFTFFFFRGQVDFRLDLEVNCNLLTAPLHFVLSIWLLLLWRLDRRGEPFRKVITLSQNVGLSASWRALRRLEQLCCLFTHVQLYVDYLLDWALGAGRVHCILRRSGGGLWSVERVLVILRGRTEPHYWWHFLLGLVNWLAWWIVARR
jgi:hypothetical protein